MPDRPGATDSSDRQAAADGGYFASLTLAGYMRLTTFNQDGMPVACTVHGLVDGDRAYFRARNQSGTEKRLRHTHAVRVAPCGALGFFSYGPPLDALARRLTDGEASAVGAPPGRRFATRLLRSQAVYYQLAADDAESVQGRPPGGLATLTIRVHVTQGSVHGNAATPTSLAVLCLPAIESRSCPPDHTWIVTATMSPPAGSPGQAG